MKRRTLAPLAWQWLIALLAVAALLLLASDMHSALGPLRAHSEGSLGLVLSDQQSVSPFGQDSHGLSIVQLAPDSPLRFAGAGTGDLLRFERPLDRWRKFAVGELVPVTLLHGKDRRALLLKAQPAPISFVEYFDYLGRYVLAVPALMFCLMIGIKQPQGLAYRSLALTFLALSMNVYYTFNYAPAGPVFTFSKLVCLSTYGLIWYLCAVFCLNFQEPRPTPVRRWLQRLFPAYRALAFAGAALALWFGLGHDTPGLGLLTLGTVLGGLAICVAALVDGWRHSGGEVRQRYLWLLLSFALGALPAMLTSVDGLDLTMRGVRLTVMLTFGGQLLMYIGLVYAVLRHRIFNFGFAISRMLIFGVVSMLLLLCFGLLDWVMEREAEGAVERRVLFDAVGALAVYIFFHHLHHRIVRRIERILFQRWHQNEDRLRQFVRQAAHITESGALLEALVGALDRFTGQTGAAVYLAEPNGGYALASGSLAHAGAAVPPGDELSAALQDRPAALLCAPICSYGELALPMNHCGTLHGFVVIGSKERGESYRPDECAVLAFTAHQIGLDLHALRAEALGAELDVLARMAERQDAELRLMAGRRSHVREAQDDTAPQLPAGQSG